MFKGMVGSYVQLLSSVGNKICGKIQCRAVGTFASLLAPFLLPPVPPNTGKALRTLFFFFPSKILCGVSLSIFSGIHVLYKRLYHAGAQDGIIVESLYTLAFLDAFCNRMCYEIFVWKSVCSE